MTNKLDQVEQVDQIELPVSLNEIKYLFYV